MQTGACDGKSVLVRIAWGVLTIFLLLKIFLTLFQVIKMGILCSLAQTQMLRKNVSLCILHCAFECFDWIMILRGNVITPKRLGMFWEIG